MSAVENRRPTPNWGEFFAPLPLAAVALLVVNDTWLKPAFHSALTGKLSDIAVCFMMPLFVSELLGVAFGVSPRRRLAVGAAVTTVLFAALEVVPPVTRLALRALAVIGPHLGIVRRFQMTSDGTDLFCLAFVPLAVAYGRRRLGIARRHFSNARPATSSGRGALRGHHVAENLHESRRIVQILRQYAAQIASHPDTPRASLFIGRLDGRLDVHAKASRRR